MVSFFKSIRSTLRSIVTSDETPKGQPPSHSAQSTYSTVSYVKLSKDSSDMQVSSSNLADMDDAVHSPDVLNIRCDLRLGIPVVFAASGSETTTVHRDFKPSFATIARKISTSSLTLPRDPSWTALSLARDFELLAPLGSGSFGSVLLMRHIATKKIYAVKVLEKPIENTALFFETVRNEQTALKECQGGSSVLGLEASFHDSRNVYFLTRFCPRGSLRDVLDITGKPSPDLLRHWCRQLACGVHDMHAAGWASYDIKPDNAFVDADFSIYLGDHGLAKRLSEKGKGFQGTPGYAAPEMYGDLHDFRADIANLGAVFYNIATNNVCMSPVLLSPPQLTTTAPSSIFGTYTPRTSAKIRQGHRSSILRTTFVRVCEI